MDTYSNSEEVKKTNWLSSLVYHTKMYVLHMRVLLSGLTGLWKKGQTWKNTAKLVCG